MQLRKYTNARITVLTCLLASLLSYGGQLATLTNTSDMLIVQIVKFSKHKKQMPMSLYHTRTILSTSKWGHILK